MRIAQVIDSLYIGGAEKLQITFMRAALARGLQPILITFDCYPEKHYFQELKAMGIDIVEIKGRSLIDPGYLVKLIQTIRIKKIDLLHTHLTYSIILGGLAGCLTRTPVVASIHNLRPDSWKFLESLALRFFTTRRIAVGYMVAEVHQTGIDHYPLDIVLNPVEPIAILSDEEKFNIRSEITSDPSRLLLITVGRLHEGKGYIDLLEAINDLKETHPQILLIIVGIGTFQQAIVDKIKSLDLDNHVCLLGSRSDVPRLLAASDLYVTASHWEGLPISILEAMAAGLPVVATGVGDIPRVIKPEFGICVPARRPDRIASALRKLIADPDQRSRLGIAARAYVTRHHTPAIWLDQLLQIYEQVAP
ncbi:MAG: glycosyltransferase [Chloroflexi bacterium]|nr:glycosyltransferase [Chloroflexota bacterium]